MSTEIAVAIDMACRRWHEHMAAPLDTVREAAVAAMAVVRQDQRTTEQLEISVVLADDRMLHRLNR